MSLPFDVRLHKGDEIKTVEVDVDAVDAQRARAVAEEQYPGWVASTATLLLKPFVTTLRSAATGETTTLELWARDVMGAKRIGEARLGAGWEMTACTER
jgi:hypothetical protein